MGSRRRSLWPREHGAYAQLGVPLATALSVRTPTVAAVAFAVAACAAFLASEPLLVLVGARGARVQASEGSRARRRLIALLVIALIAGGGGLALAPLAADVVAAAALVGGGVLAMFGSRRAMHSLGGELVASGALPAAAAPVAVASGLPVRDALLVWAAWAAGYACTVGAVHRVIARHRARAGETDTWLSIVLVAACLATIVISTRMGAMIVAFPLALAALVLVAKPPRATHLRIVGVSLVIASLASAVTAIAVMN